MFSIHSMPQNLMFSTRIYPEGFNDDKFGISVCFGD